MSQHFLKSSLLRTFCLTSSVLLLISCGKKEKTVYESTADIPVNREMVAELTSPPHVPTPVGKRKAKKVKVDMEILELEGELSSGVRYMYWTLDRKSTRLNSSHVKISYAVFCLKKKKK